MTGGRASSHMRAATPAVVIANAIASRPKATCQPQARRPRASMAASRATAVHGHSESNWLLALNLAASVV